MADIPFVRGLNATARFFFNTGEQIVQFKDWTITPNVTDVTDDVNGEDRSRLDRVINYFELSGNIYVRDGKLIQAYISDITNDDGSLAPLGKAASIRLKIRDGTRFAARCKEMVWASLALGMSGRTDAAMMPFKARFRYFENVQAI